MRIGRFRPGAADRPRYWRPPVEGLFVGGYEALKPTYLAVDSLTMPLLEPLKPQPLVAEVVAVADGVIHVLTGLPTGQHDIGVPITRSSGSLPGLGGLRFR